MAIYILADPFAGRIKIGYTKNIQKRIETHRTSNPGINVLATLDVGTRATEKSLHRILEGHRCKGTKEWFVDGPTMRKVLEGILKRLGGDGLSPPVTTRHHPYHHPSQSIDK